MFEKPEIYLQNFEVSNNLESIKGIEFQKVIRIDDRSSISREFNSSSIVVKYNFFDWKICHYIDRGNEAEYIACISQRGNGFGSTLYPSTLEYNRFPIIIISNSGNNENIKRNLQISFFCPLDQGLVSVRKFDYSFDKEKIKNISKFNVAAIKN